MTYFKASFLAIFALGFPATGMARKFPGPGPCTGSLCLPDDGPIKEPICTGLGCWRRALFSGRPVPGRPDDGPIKEPLPCTEFGCLRRTLFESLFGSKPSGTAQEDDSLTFFQQDKEKWETVKESCDDVIYTLAVHVSPHITLLAMPLDTSECPPVVFHELISSDEAKGKQAAVAEYGSSQHELVLQEWSSAKVLGDHKLQELNSAFEKAKVLEEGEDFEIMERNGDVFALSMTKNLGYIADENMANFMIE